MEVVSLLEGVEAVCNGSLALVEVLASGGKPFNPLPACLWAMHYPFYQQLMDRLAELKRTYANLVLAVWGLRHGASRHVTTANIRYRIAGFLVYCSFEQRPLVAALRLELASPTIAAAIARVQGAEGGGGAEEKKRKHE